MTTTTAPFVFNSVTQCEEVRNNSHRFGVFRKDGEWNWGIFAKHFLSVPVIDNNDYFIENDEDKSKLIDFNGAPNVFFVENELDLINCPFIQYSYLDRTFYVSEKPIPVKTTDFPYNVDQLGVSTTFHTFANSYLKVGSKFSHFDSLLKRTIGIEYETTKGVLSYSLCKHLALQPLRDGSLDGGIEYASAPLTGLSALSTMIATCTLLKKNHSFDESCSLHIHFGDYPKTKEAIVALWNLCYTLQTDIGSFIPNYRKTASFISKVTLAKGKDYCSLLPDLHLRNKHTVEEKFGEIFRFMTNGYDEDEIYSLKSRRHPKKNKWDRVSRYTNLNLMPLVFDSTGTFEARWHGPTFNPYKITMWIFFIDALLTYAEQNVEDLIKNNIRVDLFDVVSVLKQRGELGEVLANELINYIDQEHNFYTSRFISNHQYVEFNEEKDRSEKWINNKSVFHTLIKKIEKILK